jgi:hypothetical protein
MAHTMGIASRAKVFWFFSSEKNCFLKPLFLLIYFWDGLSGFVRDQNVSGTFSAGRE